MKEERFNQLRNMVSKREDNSEKVTGVADGRYDESIQYVRGDIQKESKEAKRLEEAGYVLIYPKISRNPKDGKEVNEYLNQNDVMIFDKVSENPNVDTIHAIEMHYNKEESISQLAMKGEDGSLTFKADNDLKKIYDSIGIKYEEKEHGNITVTSNIKRKEVEKGKIAQIYENAKGKVKGAFNNLKNFFKGKESEKNIEQEDNER